MHSNTSSNGYKILNIASLVPSYLEELKSRGKYPELQISSLPSLNEMMWGIRKKKLTVIGARPSNGKSAFAIQCAIDIAMQNKTVLFLSLEMENVECLERILTNMNKISNMTLRTDNGIKYKDYIKSSAETLLQKRLYFSDCLGRSWEEIDAIVETKGVEFDAIFIDYIQNTKQTAKTQKEGYDEFIRHLREMAIRKNFAAVVLSQINRTSQEARDKRPYLHQLKGTGFLEEHADVCVLLHWGYKYDHTLDINEFEIHLSKNKLGRTGAFKVKYYPQYNLFTENMYGNYKEPDVSARIYGDGSEVGNILQTTNERRDHQSLEKSEGVQARTDEDPILTPEDIIWEE